MKVSNPQGCPAPSGLARRAYQDALPTHAGEGKTTLAAVRDQDDVLPAAIHLPEARRPLSLT